MRFSADVPALAAGRFRRAASLGGGLTLLGRLAHPFGSSLTAGIPALGDLRGHVTTTEPERQTEGQRNGGDDAREQDVEKVRRDT